MHDETALLTLPEPSAPTAAAQPLATAYAAHPSHGDAASYASPSADAVASAAFDVTAAHQLPVPPTAASAAPTTAAPATVAPVEADTAGSRIGLAFLAIVIALLLVCGGLLLALRPGSRPTLTDTRLASEVGAESTDVGGELGGAVPPPSLDDLAGPTATDDVAPSTTAGPAATVPPTVVIVSPPTAPPATSAPKPTVTSTTSTTQAPKPSLSFTSASVPSKVECKPTDPTPYITVSWNAPGAQSVTLSIDGPGAYKTYPGSSGSDTVPFSCPGPHTYQLTANGSGGQTVTKTFTATKK